MMLREVVLLDIKKAKEEIGRGAAVSLVDGIRHTWAALTGAGQD